jgi:hypothetical protein
LDGGDEAEVAAEDVPTITSSDDFIIIFIIKPSSNEEYDVVDKLLPNLWKWLMTVYKMDCK